jgi:hypothetical protein
VDALNSFYSSVDGVLFDKSTNTLIECPGGKAGSFTIPNSVNSIFEGAFDTCTSLSSVIIPDSVTSIGDYTFEWCQNLTNVMIGNSVTRIGEDAFNWCTSLTSVTIPNSVTSIGFYAFYNCVSLTSVTIGNSVTSIEDGAFERCISLTEACFQGNAPSLGWFVFGGYCESIDNATAYYLPGTTGWDTTFGDLPTALWKPQVQTSDGSFGVLTNQFGFNISWASGQTVVVEACTNLANPIWSPVGTNTLTSGTSNFSDPDWTNYPGRFYRLRSP